MKIENMSLTPLTEVEMQEVDGGIILVVICFAAGLAIGLGLT